MCRSSKLALILAALMSGLLGTGARAACETLQLGLFADEDYTRCWDQTIPYAYTFMQLALLHQVPVPIAEVSFRVQGLPDDSDAIVFAEFNTEFVTGDLESGITLIFDPPLEDSAPALPLGSINIFTVNPDWDQPEYQVELADAIVIDAYRQEWQPARSGLVLNPENPQDVSCADLVQDPLHQWLQVIAAAPEPGALILDDFDFSFTMESWHCSYAPPPDHIPIPYSGRIFVAGAQVHEFTGVGDGVHGFTLSNPDLPPGSVLEVEIEAVNIDDAATHCLLEYLVGETTAVGAASLSTVKSLFR